MKKINKKKHKKIKLKKPILFTKDLPATIGMLEQTEKKIISKMSSEFKKIDSRFSQMDSKFNLLMSEIHRLAILMEEQNSRNKFVLDGYALLHDKIERLEKKDLENTPGG